MDEKHELPNVEEKQKYDIDKLKEAEEKKKYEDERLRLEEEKRKLEEEERKKEAEKRRRLKIEKLNNKIKCYGECSKREDEIAQLAQKYCDDRKERAKFYFYKKELAVRKLNLMNGTPLTNNSHVLNDADKLKMIEFESELGAAFLQKGNKDVVKHLTTKRYVK